MDIPLPLISPTCPLQYDRIRHGRLAARPRDLVVDHVRDVLRAYDRASHPHLMEHV